MILPPEKAHTTGRTEVEAEAHWEQCSGVYPEKDGVPYIRERSHAKIDPVACRRGRSKTAGRVDHSQVEAAARISISEEEPGDG